MRTVASLLVAFAAAAVAAPAADQIKSLPEWRGELPSEQYSGYLNAGGEKQLHYWFSAAEKPSEYLTLWLNGGPGCSSMDGLFMENGQIHFNNDNASDLIYNPYNWATVSNMIWLEAPVGVGFSYSNDLRDYAMNDNTTADASFTALVDFFTNKFPEMADKKFYIAGESYAGVYIPTLANRIRVGNLNKESNINLQGILVGNGCTGTEIGTCGSQGSMYHAEFSWRHGLYSDELHDEITKECNWDSPSLRCEELLIQSGREEGLVNIYNILAPCSQGATQQARAPVEFPGRVGGLTGCIDSSAAGTYLNRQDVQEAIHVADARPKFKEWVICSSKIDYTSNIKNEPRDVYPQLIDVYDVLIFNGDLDACVPFIDNEAWTAGMGFDVLKRWTAWQVAGGEQSAGYLTTYNTTGAGKFAFTTVKGSGHMVPRQSFAHVLLAGIAAARPLPLLCLASPLFAVSLPRRRAEFTPAAALHMFTAWITGSDF